MLGSAFSKVCAQFEANVVIVDIDEEKGNELAKKIKLETKNNNIIFQKRNITDVNDLQKLIDEVLSRFGKIDALLNSPYPKTKNYGRKFDDVEYKDFCENINLHLGGYFLTIQKIAEVMKKQGFGNIINIASIYGFSAPRFELYDGTDMTVPVEYSCIKGGIINLTKYLASYLGKYNIRVNAISPGGVWAQQPESFIKKYSEKVLLGKKMANTDDLTGVLIFLLSDASKYVTGQNIVVDGGFTL